MPSMPSIASLSAFPLRLRHSERIERLELAEQQASLKLSQAIVAAYERVFIPSPLWAAAAVV